MDGNEKAANAYCTPLAFGSPSTIINVGTVQAGDWEAARAQHLFSLSGSDELKPAIEPLTMEITAAQQNADLHQQMEVLREALQVGSRPMLLYQLCMLLLTFHKAVHEVGMYALPALAYQLLLTLQSFPVADLLQFICFGLPAAAETTLVRRSWCQDWTAADRP